MFLIKTIQLLLLCFLFARTFKFYRTLREERNMRTLTAFFFVLIDILIFIRIHQLVQRFNKFGMCHLKFIVNFNTNFITVNVLPSHALPKRSFNRDSSHTHTIFRYIHKKRKLQKIIWASYPWIARWQKIYTYTAKRGRLLDDV